MIRRQLMITCDIKKRNRMPLYRQQIAAGVIVAGRALVPPFHWSLPLPAKRQPVLLCEGRTRRVGVRHRHGLRLRATLTWRRLPHYAARCLHYVITVAATRITNEHFISDSWLGSVNKKICLYSINLKLYTGTQIWILWFFYLAIFTSMLKLWFNLALLNRKHPVLWILLIRLYTLLSLVLTHGWIENWYEIPQ